MQTFYTLLHMSHKGRVSCPKVYGIRKSFLDFNLYINCSNLSLGLQLPVTNIVLNQSNMGPYELKMGVLKEIEYDRYASEKINITLHLQHRLRTDSCGRCSVACREISNSTRRKLSVRIESLNRNPTVRRTNSSRTGPSTYTHILMHMIILGIQKMQRWQVGGYSVALV